MSVCNQGFAASTASGRARRAGGRCSLPLAVLLAGTWLAASPANATTAVPDAQGHMYANETALDAFGAVNNQACVADFGCWDATATTSASLVATATASASDRAAAGSSGTVIYAFVVNGPADVIVPLTIRGYVSAAASGSRVESHAGIVYAGRSFNVCSVAGFGLGCGEMSASGFLSDSFSSATGVINWIDIFANGTVYKDGAYSSYADPVIAIDPLFLAANPGFSLSFSPNLTGAGSAAPEPATWALMLAGLGLAGQAVRKRRPSLAA